MVKNRNRKILKIVFIVVISVSAAFFFFNKFGILKYYSLIAQKQELEFKLEEVNSQNDLLKMQIDSLKNSDIKIEKVAREKYNMKRKGETVIKFESKETY